MPDSMPEPSPNPGGARPPASPADLAPAPQVIPEHEWALHWLRRHPTAALVALAILLLMLVTGFMVWRTWRLGVEHANVGAEPPDREPPSVIRVRPPVSPQTLVISFSEPLRVETAENPQCYEISGTNPLTATLDGPATNVVLKLATPLAFASTCALRIQGISDQAPKPNVMTPTNLLIKTPVLTRGLLRADYYLNMKWHTVDSLTGNPLYPDGYDATVYLTNSVAPGNRGDNYGLRLWGFFLPPTNGNYTFYVRSDDESDVYLSTDASAENKTLVASQTGSGRRYDDENGNPRFSTVTNLVAGQRYYFEALLKEGGGEDYLTVVYKAEGEPPPVHKTQSVTPVPSSALACYADADAAAAGTTDRAPQR